MSNTQLIGVDVSKYGTDFSVLYHRNLSANWILLGDPEPREFAQRTDSQHFPSLGQQHPNA